MELLQQNNYLVVILIGVVVGYLSGLLGKGGSAVSTPALQIFAGINPFYALASPLPAAITSTLSASAVYRKEHLFDKRVILLCALFGIPATIIGAWGSHYLKGKTLMVLTALFIIGLGVSLAITFLKKNKNCTTSNTAGKQATAANGYIIAAAFVIGLLSGLLANAGGILFSTFFIKKLHMPIKRALACSVLLSAFLSIPGTLTHWFLGHIDWGIALLLAVTALPFSWLGARTAIRMQTSLLEKLFAFSLIGFGMYDMVYTLMK
ncbi:hypothetical protein GA0116948_10385 [Chitinophaga costaii]|uniref:Probable membrane transporter protein n=1 Tax=Chitinophaga costaii TaxID=1335309 RepID=A0A1C4BGL9_9BACT|nr:sulfite exporter TauE/SafE family protein [Chitinophaga costaii]SCC05980.1 hypothetical protein GA0116948_10385 [Chitinophaga costaii]